MESNAQLITAVETLQNNYVSPIVTNTDNIVNIYDKLNGSGVNAQITGFTRPGSVYTGNTTIGVSGGSLGSQQLKTGITLKAVGGDIRVKGASSSGVYLLSSGEILFVETNNLSNLTFTTSSGSATLYYIATYMSIRNIKSSSNVGALTINGVPYTLARSDVFYYLKFIDYTKELFKAASNLTAKPTVVFYTEDATNKVILDYSLANTTDKTYLSGFFANLTQTDTFNLTNAGYLDKSELEAKYWLYFNVQ